MVREFHEVFELSHNDKPNFKDPFYGDKDLRLKLIKEEYLELIHAINKESVHNIVKEMADLLYVIYGTAVTMGVDLDEAFKLVHESNMSKLDDRGNPIFNEYGKIMKSSNYVPPDLSKVVEPNVRRKK